MPAAYFAVNADYICLDFTVFHLIQQAPTPPTTADDRVQGRGLL